MSGTCTEYFLKHDVALRDSFSNMFPILFLFFFFVYDFRIRAMCLLKQNKSKIHTNHKMLYFRG